MKNRFQNFEIFEISQKTIRFAARLLDTLEYQCSSLDNVLTINYT